MKKTFKLALITLCSLFIVACSGKNNPSTSDSPSLDDSVTSVVEELPVSQWGEEYSELIIGTLGADIPYIECPSFEIKLSIDAYGDPMVIFYLYFNDSELEEKLEEYAMIADYSGYYVEFSTQNSYDPSYGFIQYDLYYADKAISDTRGIEMQFLIGSNGYRDCIGIFAYNYVVDTPNYWPSNLVESLLGYDIPHLPDTGEYEYYAKINPEGYIDMIIYNVSATAEDEYCSILEANDYLVTEELWDEETGEYMGRYASSPDGEVIIQFGLSQYGLEIYIYKMA